VTLELRNASKIYGSRAALRGVSFRLEGPGIVGLLGPNGSGKTTTLRLLSGFFPPTSGEALFDDRPATDSAPSRVGYLPETPPLYPEMSVSAYLEFVARIKGLARPAARAAVTAVTERLSLADRRDSLIGQLSRGYRQRVGLAQALVHAPSTILLDEPTAGLDPVQIEEARAVIREAGRAATVVMSTHLLNEVELLCTRVLVLREGELAGELPIATAAARWRVTVRGASDALARAVAAAGLEPAGDASVTDGITTLLVNGGPEDGEKLSAAVAKGGLTLRALEPVRADLTADYVRLQSSARS
jgi:ABC-2 type transport system ATP-binding protein